MLEVSDIEGTLEDDALDNWPLNEPVDSRVLYLVLAPVDPVDPGVPDPPLLFRPFRGNEDIISYYHGVLLKSAPLEDMMYYSKQL